jgi:putative ABC transport system permease protein
MLSMLSQKLRRDLWQIKGQMLAIALVMASGIALFIITFGVIDSLKLSRDSYYQQNRFADIFVSLKRAPRNVLTRIEEIPGVMTIEGRITFGMTLQMPGLEEPGIGTIISIPDHKQPNLNQLYLRMGRYPDEMNIEEIIAEDSFVTAHGLKLGDKVTAILNGVLRELTIVGIALSPEFVYSIAPGAMMPDPLRYGVFWMRERALEATVGMMGAFNDLLIATEATASQEAIKNQLDIILEPYGARPSYDRDLQISNFFVQNEIAQLESMGLVAPFIFLAVAAFLINVVMSRLIQTQREQIGMLKAIGYSNWEVGRHYYKMASAVTLVGALIGVSMGLWMGSGLVTMYAEFFRFPILTYHFSLSIAILSVATCFAAVYAGIYFAIKAAIDLPPSEAMRPEPPASYKASFLTSYQWLKNLSYFSRIILRQIERRPRRAILSVLGLAMAMSILIFSFFIEDSIERLLDMQYQHAQLEDVNISFVEPIKTTSLTSVKAMQGVIMAEPIRSVAVIMKYGHREKNISLTATIKEPMLRKVLDLNLNQLTIPDSGLLMSQSLAEILKVKQGDYVTVQVLEDHQPELELEVVKISRQWIGIGAYINTDYLHRMLNQENRMNSATLLVDPLHQAELFQRLKNTPNIIGMNVVDQLRETFTEVMAENLYKSMMTNIFFATLICFGVIYNTARIALSERWRELASLRVLGLSNREVAYLLFGELSLLTMVAIPLGFLLGDFLAYGMTISLDTELFRVPFYIEHSTYGYGVIILLASTVVSFYLVWRQLTQIDLVTAQKGVE